MTTDTVAQTVDSLETRLANIESMVREVHLFCVKLSEVLTAIGENPMMAAMMPASGFGFDGE